MFCPACGQEASEEAKFCPNCGHAFEGLGQGPGSEETGGSPLALVKYAGFWRRFVALVIDEILVSIVVIGAETVANSLLGINVRLHGGGKYGFGTASGFVLGAVLHWLYWAGMESSAKQATVGKMALGLKVTDIQGEPISFGRATGRYFGKIISALILGVGFLMAGWTEKKQALHDLMAGTLVVKKQSSDE